MFLSVFSFDGARADSNNTSGANTADGQTDDGEESESLMEKGMEPFYGLVKNFLTTIQPNKISEQTWLSEYEPVLKLSLSVVCTLACTAGLGSPGKVPGTTHKVTHVSVRSAKLRTKATASYTKAAVLYFVNRKCVFRCGEGRCGWGEGGGGGQ